MDIDNILIQHLEEEFKDTKFKIIRSEYFIELLHNNPKFKGDISFENTTFDNKVFDICKEILSNEDLFKLGISFDYANKMDKVKESNIIGFTLNLNFGFTNDEDNKNEIINKIENMIDDLFKDKQDTGATLLGGKAEFIRENNDLGIKKL